MPDEPEAFDTASETGPDRWPSPGLDDTPTAPFGSSGPEPEGSPDTRGLRVTHLCHNDQMGGGPLASYRLHRAMRDQGIDSCMLVMRKFHDDPSVARSTPWPTRLIEAPARIADRLPLRFYSKRARDVIWSPGWFGHANIASDGWVRDADLLSLYWINGGFLSISGIGSLLGLGKPVVWRLSDLWPFTGGCHHAGDCTGYRRSCGSCPQLASRSPNDLSARLLRAKRRWPTERLTIVSPSRWLQRLATTSAVFHDCRIEHIATGVDIETFAPGDPIDARRELGLPEDRALVLFGANNGLSNPKKGFALLAEALERLTALGKADDVDLVIFGQSDTAAPPALPLPVRMMGFIGEEKAKATLFSAVDLFVTPSLEENLPNTVIEAMACGTPALAFDVGGTSELISHETNGYLAPFGDAAALARGLVHLLERREEMQPLRQSARRFVAAHHDNRKKARDYADLYEELCTGRRDKRAA